MSQFPLSHHIAILLANAQLGGEIYHVLLLCCRASQSKFYWNSTRDFVLPYRALEYDQVKAPPATKHNEFQFIALAMQTATQIAQGKKARGGKLQQPVHHPCCRLYDLNHARGGEVRRSYIAQLHMPTSL